MTTAKPPTAILVTALPVAAAVAVFGVIFGATAAPELGRGRTMAMSLLVFSGSLQFATLSLVASGAGAAAILLTALALNARHVVLGALLRPRVGGGMAARAGLSWFLIDESFGLAYAARERAGRTLLWSGLICYLAWQAGTALGMLGASVGALQDAAGAIFPVLFIGLAAITARGRDLVVRAVVAGVVVAVVATVLPAARPFAPILAAVAVALPGRGSR